MSLEKLLVILTGGTICQKKNKKGLLEPTKENYLDLVPKLKEEFSYDFVLFENSIDSTEMGMEERKKVVKIIEENYQNYSGFVVVQGTDTLAESASAFTYMIQGINKPLVLTGSQIPIYEDETDAKINLYNSFRLASKKDIEGIFVAFGNKVLRGSRVVKEDESSYNAFNSPKYLPLGFFEGIHLNFREAIFKKKKWKPFFFL
jgi:L-asparaginase